MLREAMDRGIILFWFRLLHRSWWIPLLLLPAIAIAIAYCYCYCYYYCYCYCYCYFHFSPEPCSNNPWHHSLPPDTLGR
jgi:hypothetical protein